MDTWGEAKWTARDLFPSLDLEDWQRNFVAATLAQPERRQSACVVYVGSPSGPKFENGWRSFTHAFRDARRSA